MSTLIREAGFHALCTTPYREIYHNLEMQISNNISRINGSNSATLNGALIEIT